MTARETAAKRGKEITRRNILIREGLVMAEILRRGGVPTWLPCVAPAPAVADPARLMLAECAKDLRLPGLRLCWFRLQRLPRNGARLPKYGTVLLGRNVRLGFLAGFTSYDHPGVVFVNACLSPYQTVLAVAHEARHHRELADGRTLKHGQVGCTREARHYAATKRPLARRLTRVAT